MLLEVSGTGELVLPAELVLAPPNTLVAVERHGEIVVLQPEGGRNNNASDGNSIRSLLEWAERNQSDVHIPVESLRREYLYD